MNSNELPATRFLKTALVLVVHGPVIWRAWSRSNDEAAPCRIVKGICVCSAVKAGEPNNTRLGAVFVTTASCMADDQSSPN